MEKDTNQGKFRICAKKLFFTYSQVDPRMTKEDVLKQLQANHKLYDFQYVISKEVHQDGGTDFHVVIIQNQKIDIRDPDTLDIEYQQQRFHGNYKPVTSLRHLIDYVCKDGDYITNIDTLMNRKLLTEKQFLIKEVNEKGKDQALLDYYERSPEKAITGISISSLKKQFEQLEKIKLALHQDEIETPFTLENFAIDEKLQKWIDNPDKTLVLVGPSCVGKTEFCKAIVKSKNLKTLCVNDKQDFERLDQSYEAIIIDTANIHEFKERQLLSVLDNQVNTTVKVLSKTVFKKAHTIQMVILSDPEFEKIADFLEKEKFYRRILFYELKANFIINVDTTIINNYNKNAKNSYKTIKNFEQHQKEEQEHIREQQRKMYEAALSYMTGRSDITDD